VSKVADGKPRFRYLFHLHEDDKKIAPPVLKYDDDTACYVQQATEVPARHAMPDLISKMPEVRLGERGRVVAADNPFLVPSAEKGKLSARTSYLTANDARKPISSEEPTDTSGNDHIHPRSLDSDPVFFDHFPQDPRAERNVSPRPGPRFNHRNDEESLELYRKYGIKYHPSESEKSNVHRAVIISNLPPQTDVAEIVARSDDAPLLSVKLIPTMGMKGKRMDGSIGVLETMTALVTFFLEASAEQFVFDTQSDRLKIRGRVAITALIGTPTFPYSLGTQDVYQRARGRLISRRIKFQQPSLVPANKFDDVLAHRSYGSQKQGWIVNKRIRKVDGKNMIMVKFAEVETAR
jgi:hypothetical protein